jgi:hypothetical protein
MSERALLQKISTVLQDMKRQGRNVKWVKYHGSRFGKAGTPDLHITLDGRSYWIELKSPGRKPTLLQQREILEWRAAGAVSEVVDSISQFLEVIR